MTAKENRIVDTIEGQGRLQSGDHDFVVLYRIHVLREILDGTTFGGRDDTPGLVDTRASLVSSDPTAWLSAATKAQLRLEDGQELAITLEEGLAPNKRRPFWIDDPSVLVSDT